MQAIEAAKSEELEAVKWHVPEMAKSSSNQNRFDGTRQDFITGESSQGINPHNRQCG